MMMFLGVTSSRSSGASCCRRQRLRMATATAFLAASWPTMYRSSAATICRGVMLSVILGFTFRCPARGRLAVQVGKDLGRGQADDLPVAPDRDRPPKEGVLVESVADPQSDGPEPVSRFLFARHRPPSSETPAKHPSRRSQDN